MKTDFLIYYMLLNACLLGLQIILAKWIGWYFDPIQSITYTLLITSIPSYVMYLQRRRISKKVHELQEAARVLKKELQRRSK